MKPMTEGQINSVMKYADLLQKVNAKSKNMPLGIDPDIQQLAEDYVDKHDVCFAESAPHQLPKTSMRANTYSDEPEISISEIIDRGRAALAQIQANNKNRVITPAPTHIPAHINWLMNTLERLGSSNKGDE